MSKSRDEGARKRTQAAVDRTRKEREKLIRVRPKQSPRDQRAIDQDIARCDRTIAHYLRTCADLGVR